MTTRLQVPGLALTDPTEFPIASGALARTGHRSNTARGYVRDPVRSTIAYVTRLLRSVIPFVVTLMSCWPNLCLAGGVTVAEAAFDTGREAIANTIVGVVLKDGVGPTTILIADGTVDSTSWTLGLNGTLDSSPFVLHINGSYDNYSMISSFYETGSLGSDTITSSGSAIFSSDGSYYYTQTINLSDPWYDFIPVVGPFLDIGVRIYDYYHSKNGDPPKKTTITEDLKGYESKDLNGAGVHINIKGGTPGSTIHQEITVTGVPEPGSLVLLGIAGVALFGGVIRSTRNKSRLGVQGCSS